MLAPMYTGSFKKDRKLMIKRGKNMDALIEVMRLLVYRADYASQQVVFYRTGTHSDLF